MTRQTIILFNSNHDPLGECSVEGGMCSSVRLNSTGERTVGSAIERLGSGRTQRLMAFTDALREWADHSGILMVVFPSERIVLWQRIAALQVSPADKYALAFAISHSSQRQQEIWNEALSMMN